MHDQRIVLADTGHAGVMPHAVFIERYCAVFVPLRPRHVFLPSKHHHANVLLVDLVENHDLVILDPPLTTPRRAGLLEMYGLDQPIPAWRIAKRLGFERDRGRHRLRRRFICRRRSFLRHNIRTKHTKSNYDGCGQTHCGFSIRRE